MVYAAVVVASKSSEGFAGTSPPAACAKTATKSRLTFLIHRAKLAIVFALLKALLGALLAATKPRASLVAENLALRQQLAILHRATPRPRLRPIDRAFWAVLSQTWSRWADVLAIVKPATVIGWHRRGFARFWTMKSKHVGRPPISAELVTLIERMASENPLWSRRRIASELAKLGHDVSKDTVAKYMPKGNGRPGRPQSTTWATFLRMHVAGTLAIDFLTVPTVSFKVLYVFFVLSLERRRISHVNVTAHPHAAWATQQMVEAVGFDATLSRVIRDRDGIYGKVFDARVRRLGLEQFCIAPRSPWQNGYAERFVGTLRRELLDHVIVLGERHLLSLVRQHASYYNEDRPHMSLDRDAPNSRPVEPQRSGRVVAFPRVAGLHRRYSRVAWSLFSHNNWSRREGSRRVRTTALVVTPLEPRGRLWNVRMLMPAAARACYRARQGSG
jgi:putative transposase